MTLAPVTRDCCCGSYAARHGEHTPECAAAFKAKLFGCVADARAVHAEYGCGHPALDGSPACATCGDGGTIMVGVGPIDRLSGQPDGTVEVPCPACSRGDDVAERRVGLAEFDALSRAALSPAPVTAADFLPAASRRNHSPGGTS
jgi:hypothetical protein